MKKLELIKFLNEYLKIDQYEDTSKNGLQVDNTKNDIKKIGYAVDASTYIFDKAIRENVDMIICHHGLFWGNEQVLTGLLYERVKKLISSDVGLYACHLPLDGNQEVGNNIVMLNKFVEYFNLGKSKYNIDKFGFYHGQSIGFSLNLKLSIKYENLIKFSQDIGLKIDDYNFGNKPEVKSICFVSGGGGSALFEAKEKGFDVFVTGEMNHSDIMFSKEMGQSVLLGGHYETEIFGVQALAEKLKKDFGIDVVFLDEKY